MKKILSIETEIEALKIKDLLESKGIPHIIRSFHDSAYDGLFQGQQGWGVLMADPEHEAEILKLLKE